MKYKFILYNLFMIKQIPMSDDILELRLDSMYPGQDINIVKIEGDEFAIHYGYFIDKKMVGVLSIFVKSISIQMRKVAVLPEYQGKGIGSKLIMNVLKLLEGKIFLNARIDKMEFYKKIGFIEQEGSEFPKNGFTLKRMEYSK